MTTKERDELMHNINNHLAIIVGNLSINKEINRELLIKQAFRISEYLKTLEVDEK